MKEKCKKMWKIEIKNKDVVTVESVWKFGLFRDTGFTWKVSWQTIYMNNKKILIISSLPIISFFLSLFYKGDSIVALEIFNSLHNI